MSATGKIVEAHFADFAQLLLQVANLRILLRTGTARAHWSQPSKVELALRSRSKAPHRGGTVLQRGAVGRAERAAAPRRRASCASGAEPHRTCFATKGRAEHSGRPPRSTVTAENVTAAAAMMAPASQREPAAARAAIRGSRIITPEALAIG
mmetsp:Transcript_90642/g.166360  ORF Transcript_90642/g.166360 Transcript_90642/m.166360 type:complete len:152 (+) Transcript_90642:137-592(+)